MNSRRRSAGRVLVFGMLTALLGLVVTALTTNPASAVNPEPVQGNPDCSDLGYGFGFKINLAPNGTFALVDNGSDFELTGGAIADPANSVTISNSDGTTFDWSSTLSIDAVFVKGGTVDGNAGGNVYVYDPEATSDTGLTTPNGQEVSHIEFCYDYELSATKSAVGEFDRTIDWELTKSVDLDAHVGFAGDSFTSTWTVAATKTVIDSNYEVTGDITIVNPAPTAVDVSVSDLIDGSIAAAVSCPSTTVPASGSLVCPYAATEADGIDGTQTTNEATITSLTTGVEGATATAGVSFTADVTGDETVTIDDDRDTEGQFPTTISDGTTFTYDETFSCSTTESDYTDGVDQDNYPNTATAKGGSTDLSADADVDVTCYLWEVSKTANGSYNDLYEWDIEKTVDPASQSGFAGDNLEWTWSITWASSFVEEVNHAVDGIITVTNPADIALTVDVTDTLTGDIAATVNCDGNGATSLTIAANSSDTCTYTAAPGTQAANNTATATRNGVSVSDTVPVNWDQGPDLGLDATITDSDNVDIPLDSAQPFTYTDSIDCSTDAGDYGDDGTYTGSADNTATITWTDGNDSSTANTTWTCYLWEVSKTANGSYNDLYEWDIEKTVDPASQSGFAGDNLEWTWSITWASSFVEEVNHAVDGIITVTNPADIALTVDVTDTLTGDIAATVNCDGNGATSLTIAANSSDTCTYTAAPGTQAANNTATATRNGVSVSDTVPVNWDQGPDLGLDATITDSDNVDIPLDSAQPFTYTDSIDCSTDAGDYGDDGTYTGSADNTATITWTDGNDSSTANTTWTCEAGFMTLKKLTAGVVDDSRDWNFSVYVGPDGFGSTQVGSTSSTLGDADGVLTFGDPALRPDTTYTVCETNVPAGWSTEWKVDTNGDGVADTIVIPYNPNADDDTPEDLGNRCFDFGAGTAYPIAVGETLVFEVNNTFPGGDPRTPGYWKNWNRCSGGRQAENADRNGGPSEGFWLLDDILNSPGVSWSDDGYSFTITTCEQAVSILDQRDGSTGRKKANDAAYTLAMHLLAAELNFAAGAETCSAAQQAALEAEQLLIGLEFDGTGSYLRPRDADYQTALDLAATLDEYNNGELCGP